MAGNTDNMIVAAAATSNETGPCGTTIDDEDGMGRRGTFSLTITFLDMESYDYKRGKIFIFKEADIY